MPRRAILAFALTCLATATAAEEGGPPFGQMLAEGRYREAYEAAAHDGAPPDPAMLEQLARTLLEQETRSADNYQRWFAMRAMRGLEDRDLAAAVRPLADSDDRYVQALALEVLTNADPEGSREVFLGKLDSPFRTVRLRALRGLERLRDPATISRLGTVLASDDDPEIRAFAARTLGATGSRQAIPVLRPALDDRNDLVREEAVAALVQLGDETIVDVIGGRLAAAPPLERARAIRLAGLVPDPRILTALAPMLADGDPEVRSFAAGAILSIRHRLVEKNDGD